MNNTHKNKEQKMKKKKKQRKDIANTRKAEPKKENYFR